MSNFRVGQKVVCINDKNFNHRYGEECPKNGHIYSIRGIYPSGDSVWLEEIINPKFAYKQGIGEVAFFKWRFRPLVDRPTSIECFQKMLKNDEHRNRRDLERLNEERGAPMELPLQ